MNTPRTHYPQDGWAIEIGAWALALAIPIAAFAILMAIL